METREGSTKDITLLQNELEQFAHLVQTLSYELTVLQDFMKENYGPRFEAYRKTHLSSQPVENRNIIPQFSCDVMMGRRGKVSTAGPLSKKPKIVSSAQPHQHRQKIEVEEESGGGYDNTSDDDGSNFDETVGDGGDSMQMEVGEGFNYSNYTAQKEADDDADHRPDTDNDDDEGDYHPDGGDDDDDIEMKATPVGHSSSFGRGKPKSDIWRHYIVTRLPNGKVHSKCRKCYSSVSSKVERLKTHYKKCSLGVDYSSEQIVNKEKGARLLNKSQVKDRRKLASSPTSSTTGDPAGRGRRLDPIWSYFNVIDEPGQKNKKWKSMSTVNCKKCGLKVSNKVMRMRKHFIVCNELDKPEAAGSPSGSNLLAVTSNSSDR